MAPVHGPDLGESRLGIWFVNLRWESVGVRQMMYIDLSKLMDANLSVYKVSPQPKEGRLVVLHSLVGALGDSGCF